jgi:HTH-type transcriptional regulator/antitoxin HipB
MGLHQRQISDLERSKMDARLSTIQNVARALDLELMLVPRQLIATVEGLQRAEPARALGRPLYALAEGEDTEDEGEESPQPRQTKGPG